MYPATDPAEAKVDHLLLTIIFNDRFHYRTPVKHDTALECIRTLAATRVVKFYNYTNTMRTCTDAIRTANDTPRIPVHAAYKAVHYRAEIFLRHSKQYMF